MTDKRKTKKSGPARKAAKDKAKLEAKLRKALKAEADRLTRHQGNGR